ncbi:MAG: nuclear transport factor 2 family protein [Chitinophagaceae bacterium]
MVQPFHKQGKKLIGHEYPPAEEARNVEDMITEMKSQLQKLYPDGGTLRQAHPKMHGCVHAEFTVESGLPENLQTGIFKTASTYPCLLRFSNANSKVQADAKKDIRGMAIKLLNVPGEKLLINEQNATEQDFLLISHNIFVSHNLAEFQKTIKAVTSGKILGYFLNPFHWGVLFRTLKSFKVCNHVLDISYWSTTPYQFGDITKAVKYHAKPSANQALAYEDTKSADYLRVNLAATLAKQDVYYDFFVQFQTDAELMPVEDPTVEWKSDFIKCATIKIPKQVFDTPSQNALGENLSFTPWHSLPEHRPIGGINRGRKHAYEAMASFRLERNHVDLKNTAAAIDSKSKNTDMTNPANEQIVQQLFTSYLKGDLTGVVALLDPAVVWLEPGSPDIPFAGTFTGLTNVEKMLGMEGQLLKVTSFVPKAYFSNENIVIVLGADSANVLATGKSYSTDWTMEFTLANGKIIRVQTFMDTNAIAKAFV